MEPVLVTWSTGPYFVLLLFSRGGTSAFKIWWISDQFAWYFRSCSFGMVAQLDGLGPWCSWFSSNCGVLTCWKTERLKFIRFLLYWYSVGRLQCCIVEIVFLVDFVGTRCKCCFVRTWRTFSMFALYCLSVGKKYVHELNLVMLVSFVKRVLWPYLLFRPKGAGPF